MGQGTDYVFDYQGDAWTAQHASLWNRIVGQAAAMRAEVEKPQSQRDSEDKALLEQYIARATSAAVVFAEVDL